MSTRSGKRIHGSFHENIVEPDSELVSKSERKTRSRRLKNNDEIIVPKSKKRNNYVSYPVDDELVESKMKLHANEQLDAQQTLKEQDLNVSLKVSDDGAVKTIRQTRRTKKFSETLNDDAAVIEVLDNVKTKKKSKKNSKKKKEQSVTEVNENEVPTVGNKKNKKKKGKKANALEGNSFEVRNLNKSNGSVDSFHSAAGSPVKQESLTEVIQPNGSFTSSQRASKRAKADSCEDINNACLKEHKQSSKKRKLSTVESVTDDNNKSQVTENMSIEKDATFDKSDDVPKPGNTTFEKEQGKRKSSIKNTTFDRTETPSKTTKKLNATFEKTATPTPKKGFKPVKEDTKVKRVSLRASVADTPAKKDTFNSTFDKSKEGQTVLNGTFEKSSRQSALNSTYEKANDSKQKSLNSTFEKTKKSRDTTLNQTFEKSNSTFEKRKSIRQSLNATFEKVNESTKLNSTFDKSKDSQQPTLNSTFEKSKDSQRTLDSTFDKETKLNSTFDKNEKCDSSKSSLISSDNSSNVTSDKSEDNFHISITSNDSRTENIVNTTPLLIESSMDESQMSEPTPSKKDSEEEKIVKPSVTPLKREGTFTKDGPEVLGSPKPKSSTNVTPVKRMSLPSPGSTPFPFSKSSQKEKCMLNVTRSIEKATRRSSLAEPAQRMTKVMFCSPVNNPAVVMQQKRKVIKSSMKGSNKSFVFDESVSEVVRPAARKRSYTQSDADDARSKRKRLADPQQLSVDRLSRPRTCSATVKLSAPAAATPPRATPRAARTRLPDFASLHQKQFARMESLDECQQRKARRARQLLTPSAPGTLAERSSPRDAKVAVPEPVKAVKEAAKKVDTPSKKVATPTKTPKVPTLMSLRPGYTRFGFKMHLDGNPFTIPPKETKATNKKPNGTLTRQPSQPSLAGTTSNRREIAKQTVMREKSFTSLSDKRNVTRKENRSVIKGVRTNRRFELQMKMRNINS